METRLATFGIWELLVILLIVVVIFGASRLPSLGGALGKSIRNFRKSFKDDEAEEPGGGALHEGKRPVELPEGGASWEEKKAPGVTSERDKH